MPELLDTNAKALKVNLDPVPYGAFAEIGGGQEVSRWFFRVGGAAGTVAKTVSAYDMAVSDAIYGAGERYVSRERLRSMLAHEYGLVVERLGAARGAKTAFFAFADTVATRSFKGGNECHGWIGLRFQHAPGSEPSDILVHTALQDPSSLQQQQSLGVLGVNLIYAACYLRGSMPEMVKSLLDGLTLDNLEIDAVDCSGPAFPGIAGQRALALTMLEEGVTRVVVFDEEGRMEQPSTVLRKRPLLVHRCSLTQENPELDRMLGGAAALLRKEAPEAEKEPLRLLEVSTTGFAGGVDRTSGDVSRSVEQAFRPGCCAMLTRFAEHFRVSMYLRRYSVEPIRFVIGLDAAVTTLRERFYSQIEGGLLEGLGRLLTPNTKLYVYPMAAGVLREHLMRHAIEPGFWSAPDKPVLGVDDLKLAAPAGHLLDFLKSADLVRGIVPVEGER